MNPEESILSPDKNISPSQNTKEKKVNQNESLLPPPPQNTSQSDVPPLIPNESKSNGSVNQISTIPEEDYPRPTRTFSGGPGNPTIPDKEPIPFVPPSTLNAVPDWQLKLIEKKKSSARIGPVSPEPVKKADRYSVSF